MNFDFLKEQNGYYDLFSDACLEAERVLASSPAMCAVGCRKALELAVKWVYAADSTIRMPYKDNLSSLLHEITFKECVDERVWRSLIGINKLGNLSVHTDKKVTAADAMLSLRSLFYFVDWIDYCYGPSYVDRSFDEKRVPAATVALSREQIEAIRVRESLIASKDADIKVLEDEIRSMREQLAAAKAENVEARAFNPEEISEFETRKRYIDWDLQLVGWTIGDGAIVEREVHGMPDGQGGNANVGYIDYLLLGKDGKPLAVLEAKRTMHSAQKGLQQARLYASCLEAEYGYKPPIFLSNGFETFFVDDDSSPMRAVSGVFSRDDLQRIVNRRGRVCALSTVRIDEEIAGGAGRYYQMEAVRRVCANIEEGHRKSLLVMATGTGKTRTAIALTDVLQRANRVKNVLFLADRKALVKQATNAFRKHLPETSRCNLCEDKKNRDARVILSTYPTILNAIDAVRNEDGERLYTPAHFDLIIVDEAHRSIFKKYKAIFEYFDALVVGLTATPADEVDRNTYDFFEVERGVPTYVYEYKTATEQDHVLVPFLGIETHTSFLDEGITYDDLSEEDRATLEEDFEAAGQDAPDYIAPSAIDSWVFNNDTVDSVLETLMEKGIHVNGGQDLGKTIIFAQSQKHARFIVERFGKIYPDYPGDYMKTVLHSDDYSHTIIDEFEMKPRPVIAVSVDMMDTGIDVPEVVNLVFFKKVRSKIKFWQMIGRGTRLCAGLGVLDPLDGAHDDKQRFFIFDWCHNFEFFRENPRVVEGKMGASLSEAVFCRQAELAHDFQEAAFAGDEYQAWRGGLVSTMHYQVVSLSDDLVSVRMRRRAVEKFRQERSYVVISEVDLESLKVDVAPLVRNDEEDIDALRFDAMIYGFMCALCSGASTKRYSSGLVSVAAGLQQVVTVPQVREKLPLLQRITEEGFFEDVDPLALERVREELRGLIRFLPKGTGHRDVVTRLSDPVTSISYGVEADLGEDFVDYKLKVERFLSDYGNSLVIHKLKNNLPMTKVEFQELERIFTRELGTAKDYERAYGDTPFGLLVRKTVHLERQAAMDAFAEFINSENLSEQQISFVHRVVDYIVKNGYMEPAALAQPPFDRPQSFVRMFDDRQRTGLIAIINRIKENAEKPAA